LKNIQFCPSSRKAKILTRGILLVFRGLKFEPDDEIGQKGALCKGLARSAGFTLMEVLVALAIMGIAVTYVIQLFSVNLGSISASDSHVAAVMRAESKMRQLLDEVPADEKSWSEVTDDGYRMDLTVSDVLPERTENLHVKLIEIDLTLHWQQGSKEKALTLSTLKIVDKL
jgi:type II secretion system protein I